MFERLLDPGRQVSVVVPAYESEQFIEATLATVAAQTRLPREVIVVDDGSTDKTCEVVEKFSSRNATLKIRLLKESHRGPGAARNSGILAAEGAWIAFLDSDDLWEPAKLERMTELAIEAPEANFLCHNEMHKKVSGETSLSNYFLKYTTFRSLTSQLYTNNIISTSTVMCPRQLILDCGSFDQTLTNAQDYELWLRMSPRLRVLCVPEVLGTYVDRRGNITSSNRWRRLLNVLRVLYRHKNKVSPFTSTWAMIRTVIAYSIAR